MKPNVYSYTAAMAACFKGGQHGKLLELLDEMKKSGVTPNDQTYKTLIEGLYRTPGGMEHALSLFADAREEGLFHRVICDSPTEASNNTSTSGAEEILDVVDLSPGASQDTDTATATAADTEAAADSTGPGTTGSSPLSSSSSSPPPSRQQAPGPDLTLDLHGLSAVIARVVLRFVLDEMAGGSRPITDTSVVTGWGKHSNAAQGPVLMHDARNYVAKELKPALEVLEVAGNPGRFRISADSIRHWASAQGMEVDASEKQSPASGRRRGRGVSSAVLGAGATS